MNYKEIEKMLNEIRNEDEMMFRMAVSHLMDVGIRHLTTFPGNKIKEAINGTYISDPSINTLIKLWICVLKNIFLCKFYFSIW